jgi:hypothetical protein
VMIMWLSNEEQTRERERCIRGSAVPAGLLPCHRGRKIYMDDFAALPAGPTGIGTGRNYEFAITCCF